jgi:phage-related protein
MSSKDTVWLSGEVKSPPFSVKARREVGLLLRKLQNGEIIGLPSSRPMPGIAAHCHELRVQDDDKSWRIIYRIDPDAIVIADIFIKKISSTPHSIIRTCKMRYIDYDSD